MKKTAAILLIFIYAVSSSGFALKADYCCEKLQSIKVVLADKARDKEGCCKIKYQIFKVKDAHAAADVAHAPAAPDMFVALLDEYLHNIDLGHVVTNQYISIH